MSDTWDISVDPADRLEYHDPILTAPCGCTFRGRVYSTASCTKVDHDTQTGHQLMRHAMNAKKKAV